jgi:hypothetical protein
VKDWEDNHFDWQPGMLNFKAQHEVKVKSIKQLRPLVSGQPWGIFFVEFNQGRLPITALRRVLNGMNLNHLTAWSRIWPLSKPQYSHAPVFDSALSPDFSLR